MDQNRVRAAPNDLPQAPYEETPEPELFAIPRMVAVICPSGANGFWDSGKLRVIMREQDLNQYTLAELMGVTQPAVNGWCNDKTPSERMIYKLVEVLGCNILDLFTEDSHMAGLAQGIAAWSDRRNGNGRV